MLAGDGCLHALDPSTGHSRLLLSAKVCASLHAALACGGFAPTASEQGTEDFKHTSMLREQVGQPRCCALDPAAGLLCIAGEGAGRQGHCMSLWRLPDRNALPPQLLARAGRPARLPLFSGLLGSREEPAWSACLSSGARRIALARPGLPLHALSWEVRAASWCIPTAGGCILWKKSLLIFVAAQERPGGVDLLQESSQAAPAWAAGAQQVAAWGAAHVAVLGCSGDVIIADAASWEHAACHAGFPAGSVLAAAGGRPCLAILTPAAAVPAAGAVSAEPGWQLVLLQDKSAQEELGELLALQDWDAALALTQRHGLPADPVHQCALASLVMMSGTSLHQDSLLHFEDTGATAEVSDVALHAGHVGRPARSAWMACSAAWRGLLTAHGQLSSACPGLVRTLRHRQRCCSMAWTTAPGWAPRSQRPAPAAAAVRWERLPGGAASGCSCWRSRTGCAPSSVYTTGAASRALS